MIKLIHTADLHLGSPIAGLPEDVSSELREELFTTLAKICELAESERADAILISGDLFDEPSPSRSVADRTFALLGRAGVPVFISPGNHDYMSVHSVYRRQDLPENVRIFRSERIEKIPCGEFDVYGAGFAAPVVERELLQGFRAEQGRHSVMVLHGEADVSSAYYHAVSPRDIAASGLSYLALGHIHARSEAVRAGDTLFAYPGCPMGRGFDETGEKGVYIVEIEERARARFVPLGARKFVTIESGERAVPDGFERDLVKLVLTGESEPIDTEALARELAPRAFYVKVVDRTRLPKRVRELAAEDSLAGAFLRALDAVRAESGDSGNAESEALAELAARYGLAALDGEEAPL